MRLIDADELKPDMKTFLFSYSEELTKSYSQEAIDKAPTIEAEPVRHGHWLFKDDLYPLCSECGELSDYECDGTHKQSLYCPNCGAKMEAEK